VSAPVEAAATGALPARRRRPTPPLVGLVIAVLLGAVLAVTAWARPEPAPSAAALRTVTVVPADARTEPVEVAGTSLIGEPVSSATYRGAPAVLNVWGSWCAPCRTEAPVLRSVSADYAARGVRFLGIDVKDNPAAALSFERRYGIDYPSLDDRTGAATRALAEHLPAATVPATLVLDRQGRVAARVLGAVEESTLRALVDDVLEEA
jgi:thiol-disulfide isomerase/thioredoxin